MSIGRCVFGPAHRVVDVSNAGAGSKETTADDRIVEHEGSQQIGHSLMDGAIVHPHRREGQRLVELVVHAVTVLVVDDVGERGRVDTTVTGDEEVHADAVPERVAGGEDVDRSRHHVVEAREAGVESLDVVVGDIDVIESVTFGVV